MKRYLEYSDPHVNETAFADPMIGHDLVRGMHQDLNGINREFANAMDTSWLHAAAEEYELSSRLSDYVLLSAPVMIAGAPNRNGVRFTEKSLREICALEGRPRFETWIGKPTHKEHCMIDKAPKGVIFGARLEKLSAYVGAPTALFLLSGFDRTKDPMLANEIMTGHRPYVSMGAAVGRYQCTACGVPVIPGEPERCEHASKNSPKITMDKAGVLHCADCLDFVGYENSSVWMPAYAYAAGHVLVDESKKQFVPTIG